MGLMGPADVLSRPYTQSYKAGLHHNGKDALYVPTPQDHSATACDHDRMTQLHTPSPRLQQTSSDEMSPSVVYIPAFRATRVIVGDERIPLGEMSWSSLNSSNDPSPPISIPA